MKLNNNIKTFRELKKLTQEALASKTEVTVNYLSLLENGKREPSLELLKKISKILEVPIPVLILQVPTDPKDPMDKLLNELYKIAISTNK